MDDSSDDEDRPLDDGGDDDKKLYEPTEDDENEAWVYQNMRGGVAELVNVRFNKASVEGKGKEKDAMEDGACDAKSGSETCMDGADDRPESSAKLQVNANANANVNANEQIRLLKPRHSDAVLSCPCCFTIVCMDCQKHERYEQYRAMFVMSIVVDWGFQLAYDEKSKSLVEATGGEAAAAPAIGKKGGAGAAAAGEAGSLVEAPGAETIETTGENTGAAKGGAPAAALFYRVNCGHCGTNVAVLNMDDEVYHFSGCVASFS